MTSPTQTPDEMQERVERIEQALRTLAWWLVQAQTGFGVQDARGIEAILDGNSRASLRQRDAE